MIWIYIVCSVLSVPVFGVKMVYVIQFQKVLIKMLLWK